MHVRAYVWVYMIQDVCEVQKKVLDSLYLELEATVM